MDVTRVKIKIKIKNFSFTKTKALSIFDGSFQVRNHVQVIKVGPGGKILWIPVAVRAEDSIFCVRYEAFK